MDVPPYAVEHPSCRPDLFIVSATWNIGHQCGYVRWLERGPIHAQCFEARRGGARYAFLLLDKSSPARGTFGTVQHLLFETPAGPPVAAVAAGRLDGRTWVTEMDKPGLEQGWVDASLFYVETKRKEGDPDTIRRRGVVVYGEALLRHDEIPPKARIYKEGAKLQRLEWQGRLDNFADMLQHPSWDHPGGELRFSFGLARRPSLIALPPASLVSAGHDAGVLPIAQTGAEVHPFVCVKKEATAASLVAACGGHDSAAAFLDRLKQLTHRDLRGRDVALFGDVYLVSDRYNPADPVEWETAVDENGLATRVRVDINDALVGEAITVNVRVYGADLVVVDDRIFVWQRGTPTRRVLEVNQEIGGAWLRAWDGTRLIAEQACSLLREIHLNGMIAGESLRIEDKLTAKTRRAFQSGKATPDSLDRVSTITRGTPLRSTVTLDNGAGWGHTRTSAPAAVHRHIRPTFDQDAYFPAGADGRAMAVLTLAERIDSGDSASLVDPYFDVEGAADLLVRLTNLDLPLTIVTWLGPAGSERVEALLAWLRRMAQEHVVPARMEVWQLPGADQPFHDRVLTVVSSGSPGVYMLSNSLSGMAKNFPLIVATLSAGTAWAVQEEVQRLVERARVDGVRIWPEAAVTADGLAQPTSRHMRDQLFDGWKTLLGLVVQPAHDSDDAWVDAACGEALMYREVGHAHWRLQAARPELQERLRKGLHDLLASNAWLALHLMGEADARGVRFDAAEVADALRQAYVGDAAVTTICAHLRETFVPPGTSRERNFLAECFRPASSRQIVEAAFYAWNGRHSEIERWPRSWGREYAFALLGHLNPVLAVALSDELHDITLVVLSAGLFRDGIGDIASLPQAMVTARSAFLRAFGAQSLSVSRTRARGSNHIVAPDDVPKRVSELRALGARTDELINFLVTWSKHADDERRRQLAGELVLELCGSATDDATRRDVLSECLNHVRSVVPLLFASLESIDENAAMRLCRSMMAAMPSWIPVSESERNARTFCEGHLTICRAFARAAGWLSKRDGVPPASIVKNAMAVDKIEKLTRPASPLMARPGRIPAVNALGWIAACSFLAASSPEQQEEARREAQQLLRDWGSDCDAELLSTLSDLLAGPA